MRDSLTELLGVIFALIPVMLVLGWWAFVLYAIQHFIFKFW